MSVAALAEVIEPTQQVGLMFSVNSWGWPGVHCLSQQVKMLSLPYKSMVKLAMLWKVVYCSL